MKGVTLNGGRDQLRNLLEIRSRLLEQLLVAPRVRELNALDIELQSPFPQISELGRLDESRRVEGHCLCEDGASEEHERSVIVGVTHEVLEEGHQDLIEHPLEVIACVNGGKARIADGGPESVETLRL